VLLSEKLGYFHPAAAATLTGTQQQVLFLSFSSLIQKEVCAVKEGCDVPVDV